MPTRTHSLFVNESSASSSSSSSSSFSVLQSDLVLAVPRYVRLTRSIRSYLIILLASQAPEGSVPPLACVAITHPSHLDARLARPCVSQGFHLPSKRCDGHVAVCGSRVQANIECHHFSRRKVTSGVGVIIQSVLDKVQKSGRSCLCAIGWACFLYVCVRVCACVCVCVRVSVRHTRI